MFLPLRENAHGLLLPEDRDPGDLDQRAQPCRSLVVPRSVIRSSNDFRSRFALVSPVSSGPLSSSLLKQSVEMLNQHETRAKTPKKKPTNETNVGVQIAGATRG